ncbi:kinase-like protein, partial [Aspergillus saccharolyticus JOP 1030-1]
INGVESLEKYCLGGYYSILIGDMLRGRYCIVDKLGFGGYLTIWLALDTCQHRYVAVIVGIAGSNSNEINILRALAHPGHYSIPTPLDQFELDGPNGIYLCYTITLARCNLREVSFSRLFPLKITRALSGGLTLAIAYMHPQGYVHGDIHLRNVLVRVPSNFDKLSVEQTYEEYGEPQTVSVARCDGMPLPLNIPAKAVAGVIVRVSC